MFFTDLIVFSDITINKNFLNNINENYNQIIKIQKNNEISNIVEVDKIGIIDFRFILKRSNAMKILGNKFLTLEKEINNKLKQKQIYLKKKEDRIKKSKGNLSELEYKKLLNFLKKKFFKYKNLIKMRDLLLINLFKKFKKISRIY